MGYEHFNRIRRNENRLVTSGTDGDDLFEIDLSLPGQIVLNGTTISYDRMIDVDINRIQLESQGGQDQVVIKTGSDSTRYHVNGTRLVDRITRQEVYFGDIPMVEVSAVLPESQVVLVDSVGDDILVSYPQFSALMTAEREIVVSDFERVTANSNSGFDQAFVFDSIGVDEIFTDMNSVEIAVGESSRTFSGYSEFELDSTSGLDEFVVQACPARTRWRRKSKASSTPF